MRLPVTIDPRYHDAVLLDLDGALTSEVPLFGATVDLARKLRSIGVAAAAYSSSPQCRQALQDAGIDDLFGVCIDGTAGGRGTAENPDPAVLLDAAGQLGVRPQRCVVVENSAAGVAAGRDGGFALVVGIDGTGSADELVRHGADVVLDDLADVAVRTGDTRISKLPNALESYGQLIGITSARESMLFLDYDGTLSPIVSDPGAARLADGAAEALELVSTVCPVAILSGRDLADISDRVAIEGLWYAGSHGFELTEPDGTYHCNEEAAVFVPILEQAAADLRQSLAQVPGLRVEHKRFAVAVHYREVAPERVAEIVSAAHQLGARAGLRVTSGRKLVELRPDLDWDKGTTLAWIRDRIDPSGSLLPIYIGDDLTDEDAFDAVQFDGIGIVVRSDEDGNRRTAAHFTLQSPDQVREFIQRGSQWLAYKQQASGEAWDYVFDGYEPQNEKLREALCTVGNGYFATRGAAPESKASQVHYPGTYAAGVFNRLVDNVSGTEIDNESLVNLPNWLALTFRIDDGDWFDIDEVTVLSYRQTLDLRGAVLTRKVRFRDDAGRTSSLTQRRFVAMHLPHVGALETTVLAEDWSGTIEFRSTLDGNVTNSLVERYRDLANEHLGSIDTRRIADDAVLLTAQTNQSRIPIAMAARNTVWRDGVPVPATFQLFERDAEVGHDIAVRQSIGEEVTVEKVVTVYTGRDVAISEPGVDAQRLVTRLPRFAELLAGHVTDWTHLWERLSIEFDDFTDEVRILRLHLLHLLQTVSPNTADLDAGVPARGLHGEAYRGHIFWDELFIFPVLNLRLPMVTRSLLGYRYRRLPEARQAALAAGHSGAMFPWQSGSDGREESQRLHLNPRSGRWNQTAWSRLATII
ncbi:MAG: trehalose-phosphatase, partial [Mycobacterium sp.]